MRTFVDQESANVIAGVGTHPQSGETLPVIDPATRDEIARVPLSGESDVTLAISVALEAGKQWGLVPIQQRARLNVQGAAAGPEGS